MPPRDGIGSVEWHRLGGCAAVTLIPGTLDFGTTTQGTSTTANISVKNAGTATLHITNVALGGANANDFAFSALPVTALFPPTPPAQ